MTPRTDLQAFWAKWPTSWMRYDDGEVVDASFARQLETELGVITAAITRGRCTCVGCNRVVDNAWRDADGHWCLTCLADQRDVLRAQVPPEPANGTGWKS